MFIKLGSKKYDVKVFETDEEKEIGLSNVKKMEKDEGGIFIYDEPCDVTYTMEDTSLPLDIIFINEDFEVISVRKGQPLSTEDYSEKDVQYVVELNIDSGVEKGDTLELDVDEKTSDEFFIIDSEGNAQMVLEGGERVFSIKNTKVLVNLSKKAFKSKKDSDYKKFGKKIFEFIEIQIKNKPEYVSK